MSLLKSQILDESKLQSQVGEKSYIFNKKGRSKKSISTNLMLTSLVDCFTILVVYLLVATSIGSEEIDVPEHLKLPQALHSDQLETGLVVRVERGAYYLDDKKISLNELSEALLKNKETTQNDIVIIQADKNMDFESINPAVLVGLQSGFSKVRFAVLKEEPSI